MDFQLPNMSREICRIAGIYYKAFNFVNFVILNALAKLKLAHISGSIFAESRFGEFANISLQ